MYAANKAIMSTRTVTNLTSKEKLKDKADLYRRLATLSREYKKSQLEDILGPFFNTTNDGIKGNVYQLPYKPGMPAPPNVTYSTPRYDTSLYSQPQTQQTTDAGPIQYTTPKKSDVRTVQPGDDKPKTKADIEEEIADKEHKEQIKSSLDRITSLLGLSRQEKEAKIIEDTEPQKTVYTVDPQPTKELERVIEKEESEPLSNMELDALLQEVQMKDKSITEEMYHKLYQHLSTLDEFKGMRENDVRFIALSMLKERGTDALQMPSPEFMKSKSELVEDILQHVDPDTESFKGGIGRAIDSDTYQIDYTTAGRRVLDPNTGRHVQGGVRNVQFTVNDDSTISMVINDTQGGSSSVLLHPDDYDAMIRALRANSTSVVTRLINSIANRNFPSGKSDPAKYMSTRRPAEERLYPPPKAPATSKKLPSTAPEPEEQVEVSEESISDEQRKREEVDLAEMITNFGDLIRKTTLFTRDEEPSFNINTNYQLIYRDRTDPDGRVERWYSASSSGERPSITYTTARGATRTERVRATTLVYDPEDGSTQFQVHLTNGDRLIAPATKQIFDLFYDPTPSADKKLLELIPKLQYESLRGGGMSDRSKPKRSGMRRIRVVQGKSKGKSKSKSKGSKERSDAQRKRQTESPKVLLIANEEDAYKQLYKILGSLEAGNYSDDMVSEAGRINDYLLEQGLFDKEEHRGVAAILDKHVRNSATIV